MQSSSTWMAALWVTQDLPAMAAFYEILKGNRFKDSNGLCGHVTNPYAKSMALLKGVQLAWDRGDRHVICKSNSLTALDILHQDDTMLHPYASIINQLKEFKIRNWTTSFVHTLRERN